MDTSGADQPGISGCHFLGVLIDIKQNTPSNITENDQVCIRSIHKDYRTVFRIEIISS